MLIFTIKNKTRVFLFNLGFNYKPLSFIDYLKRQANNIIEDGLKEIREMNHHLQEQNILQSSNFSALDSTLISDISIVSSQLDLPASMKKRKHQKESKTS